MTRRTFLRNSSQLVALLSASALKPADLFAAPKMKLIDEHSPAVTGLRFTQDASKSPIRKNLKASCLTCRQWMKKEGDGKEIDGVQVATCQMFSGQGYAKSTGWCMSWTKNPKITD